jgi:hypothetical protein
MRKAKITLNPEDPQQLDANAKEFVPKDIQINQMKTYTYFAIDPDNSDINYVIEAFLNNPNKETLHYITWIDDDSNFIFDYVCNYTPYSIMVYYNEKIKIDYMNKKFTLA